MKPTCLISLPMLLSLALAMFLDASASRAHAAEANYNETNVPAYTLPDPLQFAQGGAVSTARQWQQKRRLEILGLFKHHVYGQSPPPPKAVEWFQATKDPRALNGLATRKEIDIQLTTEPDGPCMHLLLYLPNGAPKPAPVFLGMNFKGNHTIHADPGIRRTKQWQRPDRNGPMTEVLPAEETRGTGASRWPVETILQRGYALATVYYGDVEPDAAEGWQHGLRAQFHPKAKSGAKTSAAESSGQSSGAPPWAAPEDWGAIGAWAWGLSRVADYFQQDPDIDPRRIALLGHSRLGKTALWAGAQDPRFAVVISNNSGCGGAALSRRRFGETVGRINRSFPHWFCGNFKSYNDQEDRLPVDQHMLIALMAPRPVYIASAEQDLWADPRGEFLAAKNADPVYRLFQASGLDVEDMPGTNQPVGTTIGYHIRTGKHDVTDYDWEQYLQFADRHFHKTNP